MGDRGNLAGPLRFLHENPQGEGGGENEDREGEIYRVPGDEGEQSAEDGAEHFPHAVGGFEDSQGLAPLFPAVQVADQGHGDGGGAGGPDSLKDSPASMVMYEPAVEANPARIPPAPYSSRLGMITFFLPNRSERTPEMGMTTPAGMENRVIKRLTCSWEMFSSDRISGRTGISMELPRTMSKGNGAQGEEDNPKAAALLLLPLLGLKQGRSPHSIGGASF